MFKKASKSVCISTIEVPHDLFSYFIILFRYEGNIQMEDTSN